MAFFRAYGTHWVKEYQFGGLAIMEVCNKNNNVLETDRYDSRNDGTYSHQTFETSDQLQISFIYKLVICTLREN